MRAAAVTLAALLGLAATSSWAQADAGKPQTGAPAAATPAVNGVKVTASKNSDQIVCIHRQQADSRIPGPKECHTRRVWDQLSDTARAETQDLQQRSQFLQPP